MEKALILLLLVWLLRRRQKNWSLAGRRRRYKTRPVFRKRAELGEMRLIRAIYDEDGEMFRTCFRVQSHQFDYILSRIGSTISKRHSNWTDSIDVKQWLAITLRYTNHSKNITLKYYPNIIQSSGKRVGLCQSIVQLCAGDRQSVQSKRWP